MTTLPYGTGPQSNKMAARSASSWSPKELSPMMLRIMDLQLFNPSIKIREISQVVGWSPSRVKRIVASDLYRTRYIERRAEIERLQHSNIAKEKARFLEIRERMLKEHMDIVEIDPLQYGVKALEAQKIRQKSITELLKVSEEHLKPASDNGGDRPSGDYEEQTRSIEIDTSDPNAAYMRIMETWRKGTK
jgi:AraC-like DNA-binding protein